MIMEGKATFKTVIKKIYDCTYDLRIGVCSDYDWSKVFALRDRMQEVINAINLLYDSNYDFEFGGGVYKKSNDGMTEYREYNFVITDKNYPGEIRRGSVICFAAGSIGNPFGKYDISLIM